MPVTPPSRPYIDRIGATDADEVLVVGPIDGDHARVARALATADLEHHPRRRLVLMEAIGRTSDGRASCLALEAILALAAQHPSQLHFLPGRLDAAFATAFPVLLSRLPNQPYLSDLLAADLAERHGDNAPIMIERMRRFVCGSALGLICFERTYVCSSVPSVEHPGPAKSPIDASLLTSSFAPQDHIEPGRAFAILWYYARSDDDVAQFAQRINVDRVVHPFPWYKPHHVQAGRVMLSSVDGQVGTMWLRRGPTGEAAQCEPGVL